VHSCSAYGSCQLVAAARTLLANATYVHSRNTWPKYRTTAQRGTAPTAIAWSARAVSATARLQQPHFAVRTAPTQLSAKTGPSDNERWQRTEGKVLREDGRVRHFGGLVASSIGAFVSRGVSGARQNHSGATPDQWPAYLSGVRSRLCRARTHSNTDQHPDALYHPDAHRDLDTETDADAATNGCRDRYRHSDADADLGALGFPCRTPRGLRFNARGRHGASPSLNIRLSYLYVAAPRPIFMTLAPENCQRDGATPRPPP